MATLLLEPPTAVAESVEMESDHGQWLVFRYSPASLFSLKMSRATSTAGKTLLTPTPYAVKMAFVDAALRHGLTEDPDELVRALARANLQIGVPQHACVTGTIQSVRQETRDVERKRNPKLPPYRGSIAMREFVHYQGVLRLAFDLETCSARLPLLLRQAAPGINYLGKRGSFVQYLDSSRVAELDSTFTQIADDNSESAWGHRATLDDFGAKADFDALNSFSPTEIQREVHRRFVETVVPLRVYNSGPGFVHYCAPGAIL
jgi:hypothetical protein